MILNSNPDKRPKTISIPCGAIRCFISYQIHCHSVISIPCGAIRWLAGWWWLWMLNLISIPCGAIRCHYSHPPLSFQAQFQFLVVRLDVIIKKEVALSHLFQFLVVRLDDAEKPCVWYSVSFQFLVVRLDVPTQIFSLTRAINFNSLWCD